MRFSPAFQKVTLVTLVILLFFRVRAFDSNPPLPTLLTIDSFTKHANNFYTANAEDFHISFSYRGKIQPQDTITYSNFSFDEKYKSYNLTKVSVTNSNPTGFSKIKKRFYYFKQDLLKQLNTVLKGKSYQLSAGMLFGDKSALSKDFKEDLTTVGLIHIVVVSGFNISLVGLLILNSFKKFGRVAYFLSFFGIVFYSVLVGLEPPVLRALIMGSIVILARVKGEETIQIYLLFLTGFIMVFLNPLILTSLSFQLSFMATLGILIFTPVFDQFIPNFLSDLSASISAQLMVLPILAYNFGQVSIISPVANILTLWAVPVITIGSGLLLLISYLSVGVATFLSFLVTIPSLVIEKSVNLLSVLNFASVNVQVNGLKVFILYFCVFSFFFYFYFYLNRQ